MKNILLLILIIIFLLVPTVEAKVLECDSCHDCSTKITQADAGDTVKLTKDIGTDRSGLYETYCINWQKDRITLDCDGYNITTPDPQAGFYDEYDTPFGIYMPYGIENKIMNCEIIGGGAGIFIGMAIQQNLQTCSRIELVHNYIHDVKKSFYPFLIYRGQAGSELQPGSGIYVSEKCQNSDYHINISYSYFDDNRDYDFFVYGDNSYVARNNFEKGKLLGYNNLIEWNVACEYGQNNIACDGTCSGDDNTCVRTAGYNDASNQNGCAYTCISFYGGDCRDSDYKINRRLTGIGSNFLGDTWGTCASLPSATECSTIEENCCTGKSASYQWCGADGYTYSCLGGGGYNKVEDCGDYCVDNNAGQASCDIDVCASCDTPLPETEDVCKCPTGCVQPEGTLIEEPGVTCNGITPDVRLNITPSRFESAWQTDTGPYQLVLNCQADGGCDPGTYKLWITAFEEPSECPEDYGLYAYDYSLAQGVPMNSYFFYCAAAKSNSGLVGFSDVKKPMIDTLAPSVYDNYIYDGSWIGTNQIVSVTAWDAWDVFESGASGISTAKYCEGAGCIPVTVFAYSDATYDMQFNVNSGQTFEKVIRYQAWDKMGYASVIGQFHVKLEKVKPTATILINDGDAQTSSKNVDLTFTYSDAHSGVALCKYWEGAEPTNWVQCTNQVSFTLSDGGGTKIVNFKVKDNTGNEQVVSDSIDIDVTPPESSMIGLSDNNDLIKDAVDSDGTVYAVGLSNTGGASKCKISWDGGTTWSEEFSAADTFKEHIYTTDGVKQAQYKCRDVAGNWDPTPAYDTILIDTTPPVTTDDTDTNWHGNPYTITLSCTDEGSCDKTYYCVYNLDGVPCDPTNLPDQKEGTSVRVTCIGEICEKMIRYYSIDIYGNLENTKTSAHSVKINNSLPTCEITTSLAAYTKSTSINLTWTGTDPSGSGIKSYEFWAKKGDDPWGVVYSGLQTSNTFTAADGYKYEFYCKTINNNNQEGISAVVSTTVDITPPSASMTQLPPLTGEEQFGVSWDGTDSVSGLKCFDVQWKAGGSWDYIKYTESGSKTQCVTFKTVTFGSLATDIQDGTTYEFRVIAKDNAGNENSASTSTKVDLGNPTCVINDLGGYTKDATFTITWQGSDNSGIKYYDLMWKTNSTWAYVPNAEHTTSTSAQFTASAEGIYYFQCIATDNTDKTGTSEIESLLYDSNGPLIEVDYDELAGLGDIVDIRANITDVVTIKSVNLVYEDKWVEPVEVIKVNDYRWEIYWRLHTNELGGSGFMISTENERGNTYEKTYTFSVQECIPGQTKTCGSGLGACVPGHRVCGNDGRWLFDCVGGIGPLPEICDGVDNNCNGIIDEILTQECGTDVGVCVKGVKTCSLGSWGACEGGIQSGSEICDDGLDNDCDGETDELCVCMSGSTQRCGIDTGACVRGTQTCANDKWGTCVGEIGPVNEICNQIDDDCDGRTDEDGVCDVPPPEPDPEPDYTWMYLIAAGVIVLLVLLLLFVYFKSKGKDLTWAELSKKWTGTDYLFSFRL